MPGHHRADTTQLFMYLIVTRKVRRGRERSHPTVRTAPSSRMSFTLMIAFSIGVHRHRLFSPPPPIVDRRIPPVPPIPERFAHHRHRARSGQPPPVIVPNADPFPFEHQLPQPRLPRPVLPPRGAPRSHHQPLMGLGGALIALNRRNAAEEENRQRNAAAQQAALRRQRFYPFTAVANALRDYFGSNDHAPPNVEYEDFGDWLEPAWEHPWDAEWLPEGVRRFDAHGVPKAGPKTPAWLPSYTHPGEVGPGFACDFDPKVNTEPPAVIVLDDDDPPSGSGTSTVPGTSNFESSVEVILALVCARCLEPLALSGQEGLSLSPEQSRRRRVWALRCGHMLDGKCVDELIHPGLPVPSLAADTAVLHDEECEGQLTAVAMGRGKGKGKAELTTTSDEVLDGTKSDSKGKGKAVDRGVLEAFDEEHSDVVLSKASEPVPEDTSIRSRLRPRPSKSNLFALSNATAPSADRIATAPRPSRPLPRRRGAARPAVTISTTPARSKGKGRARKPVVEERHEWFCPVSGCCRGHLSVRMRGEEEWKMDANLGAIALFV